MPARRTTAETPPPDEHTRREFFRGMGRNAALAAAALVTAVLAGRRRSPTRSQTCANRGICRGCGSFDACALPQALSAKRAMTGS